MLARRSITLAFLVLAVSNVSGGVNRWTLTNTGTPPITRILPDPQNRDVAYVTTATSVFRTSSAGEHWDESSDGLRGFVNGLAVAAADPTVLYAASNGVVLRSADAGAHWSSTGPIPGKVDFVAFDPIRRRVLAAARYRDLLFVSADDGETWTQASLPAGWDFKDSMAVTRSAQFALAQRNFEDRVMRSVDGGRTWRIVDRAPAFGRRMTVDGESGTIYVSVDCPDSCTVLGKQLKYPTIFASPDGRYWFPIAAVPSIDDFVVVNDIIYAATRTGAYTFDPAEGAWRRLGDAAAVQAIAVTPSTPPTLYVAPTSGGLLRRVEGDREWLEATSGLPAEPASGAVISATDPSIGYTASWNGVFKTSDGGNSWAVVSAGPASDVDIDPVDPGVAYAQERNGTGSSNRAAILKTVDGGSTWNRVTPDLSWVSSVVKIAPSDPATVYAALGTGMSKTTDGGNTWIPISNGIRLDDYDFYYGFTTRAIDVDRSDSSHVCIAKSMGIFETTDGGANWNLTAAPVHAEAVAFDDEDASIIYGGSAAYTGFFKSVAGGEWKSSGLEDKYVTAISCRGHSIYAGTGDGRIFRSDDHGEHWTAFDKGLGRERVSRIAIDQSGSHLFAATQGGVYRYAVRPDAFGPWSQPVSLGPVINTASDDMHPSLSKDGLSLIFSSNRPSGSGGLDLYVSERDTAGTGWGAPQNISALNTSADDHAPYITTDGHWLFFYSTRPGGCTDGTRTELWAAHRRSTRDNAAWDPPVNLGCTLNLAGVDQGAPMLEEDEATHTNYLYFARNATPSNSNGFDIYVSTCSGELGRCIRDRLWAPAVPLAAINSAGRDTRTAIDRRDGLQLTITTNRAGSTGGLDLWLSTRASTDEPWPPPVNLNSANAARCAELRIDPCPAVNTTANDGAAALSWDGTTMIFYSNRAGGAGGNDLYMSTRTSRPSP